MAFSASPAHAAGGVGAVGSAWLGGGVTEASPCSAVLSGTQARLHHQFLTFSHLEQLLTCWVYRAHSTHQSLILVSTFQDERPWSDLFGPGTTHDLKKAIPSSRASQTAALQGLAWWPWLFWPSPGSHLSAAWQPWAVKWETPSCFSSWGPEPRQDLKPSIY